MALGAGCGDANGTATTVMIMVCASVQHEEIISGDHVIYPHRYLHTPNGLIRAGSPHKNSAGRIESKLAPPRGRSAM